jgi:hypothetical protein
MGDQLSLDVSSLESGPENVVMVESVRKCGSGQ